MENGKQSEHKGGWLTRYTPEHDREILELKNLPYGNRTEAVKVVASNQGRTPKAIELRFSKLINSKATKSIAPAYKAKKAAKLANRFLNPYTQAEDREILKLLKVSETDLADGYRALGKQFGRSPDGIYQRLRKLESQKITGKKAPGKQGPKPRLPETWNEQLSEDLRQPATVIRQSADNPQSAAPDFTFPFSKWSFIITEQGIQIYLK